MPNAPFALLRASINGGGATSGGITVPPSATVALTADPSGTPGATQYRYEIYGYPVGFSLPSGWSSDSAGVYFYTAGSTPPVFTLPTIANWGKFMLRLKLNNGISPNPAVLPPGQLIDEATALSMLSPNGLADVGLFESNQFATSWVPPVQASLRAIDTAVTAVSGANQKPPARLLAASNVASLSGEQTIDGVLTSASRLLLIAQSTSSQNGLWLTAAGAWTRPTDFAADAQVIVGQTIFITSGSINAGTNWQLTSGSTIAGAKTYAQLVGGTTVSVLQPVDAVATTNNALSGTTAIDGVTLTANVSRVLAVAQTTSSQNGPWLVQSGAWTRPTDFTVDAQVVAGQTVYVKSGSLGAASSWQLTAGSTIGGTKIYAKAQLTRHNPVRLVQTLTLPAYTYSGGVITATANAALPATIFDGVGPSTSSPLLVGDRVLIAFGPAGETSHKDCGIYVVTQLGDGSHPYILTRASDLNISAHFVGGVQFDVIDGATTLGNQKGTRWGMSTLVAVTLDTTATTWQSIGRAEADYVKLSQVYNLTEDAVNGVFTDFGPTFRQIAWDLYQRSIARGRPQYGILPAFAMRRESPAKWRSQTGFIGPGSDHCYFTHYNRNGGFLDVLGDYKSPTVYVATTVDTATGATPIYMWDESGAAIHPWLNLTTDLLYFWNEAQATGLPETGWREFELLFNFRYMAATTGAGVAFSIKGRRTSRDALDSLCTINFPSDGSIHAELRLTDLTTGVYGAITHSGASTSAMTGDATIKPNEDIASAKIFFPTGLAAVGTVGTPTVSAITGTGNGTITALSATGYVQPGLWTLSNIKAVANGGLWQLTDPNGLLASTTVLDANGNILTSTITQTVGAGAATVISAVVPGGGTLQFTITDGSTDFALADHFTITVNGASYLLSFDGGSTWDTAIQSPNLLGTANSITFGVPSIVNGGTPTVSAITGVGNGTVTALSVTGYVQPGAWVLKNVTAVANGGVWSITDPNGDVRAAALTQTVGAGAATVFSVTNDDGGTLQFTVTDGSTDFALNDKFTITVLGQAVAADERIRGKFNFGAGSIAAGEIWSWSSSGVHTTYTLGMAAASLVAAHNYELALQLTAGAVNLYCSELGQARRTVATASGHGKVLQRPWETAIFGYDVNYSGEDYLSGLGDPAHIVLGAFRIKDSNITVPLATTQTSIPSAITTGQRAMCTFGYDAGMLRTTGCTITEGDGTTIIGWLAMGTDFTPNQAKYIIPRRNPGAIPVGSSTPIPFPVQMRAGGVGYQALFNKGGNGVLALQLTQSKLWDMRFILLGDGLRMTGPNFMTDVSDMVALGGRKHFVFVQGGCLMLGRWESDGALVNVICAGGGISQHGELFLNGEANNRGYIWLTGSFDGDTTFRNLVIDNENTAGFPKPEEIIRAEIQIGTRLTIGGSIGGGPLKIRPFTIVTATGALDLLTTPCAIKTQRSCCVKMLDVSTAPIRVHELTTCLDAVGHSVAMTNLTGKSWTSRGEPPRGVITPTTTTLSASVAKSWLMPASTTVANQALNILTAGMQEGDIIGPIKIRTQGNQVTLSINGVLQETIAASSATLTFKYQFQGAQLGGSLVEAA